MSQCPSPGFTDNPLLTVLWCHSDKNRVAINKRYLDFHPMCGLITLANDNHMDNYVTLRKCWGLFTMTRLLTVDLKNTISGGMS